MGQIFSHLGITHNVRFVAPQKILHLFRLPEHINNLFL